MQLPEAFAKPNDDVVKPIVHNNYNPKNCGYLCHRQICGSNLKNPICPRLERQGAGFLAGKEFVWRLHVPFIRYARHTARLMLRCIYACAEPYGYERAHVAQDRDIYLLDDIFASVDAHVAELLMSRVIMGVLANKTRIVVTGYGPCIALADRAITLRDGRAIHEAEHATRAVPTSQVRTCTYTAVHTV